MGEPGTKEVLRLEDLEASGGIRTAEAAVAMLRAGATRLGLSGTRAVLDGLD